MEIVTAALKSCQGVSKGSEDLVGDLEQVVGDIGTLHQNTRSGLVIGGGEAIGSEWQLAKGG